ncbi:MAG: DNA gyrase subunit A [Bacillales bacterium]|nr:DNA gyrase subunit A [Bacillales bacterium]
MPNDNEEKWIETKNVKAVELVGEMKTSFLSYAMSVIVQRALPDARDGLKPVQRRILYDMAELGMSYSSQYKKCARLVGDVMGKYHPHGDSAIYEAAVRMAQPFSYRYPLVNGHGNFGSIDGDGAAAMRYTECKMMKITEEMLKDIDKKTVPFIDNYDATEEEPVYLPAAFPNLLANGSVGIAVGMATNIPPHNLSELIDGYLALLDNPEIDISGLMQYIKGPDFPTGGIILGVQGIKNAYETGRGIIQIRSKVDVIEHANGKKALIVKEIPYAVNKTSLIEKIADLVKEKTKPGQEKKLDGITDLRDESTREGIRIVIELKKDANSEVVLNNLFKYTPLQTSFSIIMLALVDNQPEVLSLKRALQVYLDHQLQVLLNRTQFDLDKAKSKKHILEGYIIATDNIDELIHIIRNAYDDAETKVMERFNLSQEQTKAILSLPLRRLSGLEIDKIKADLEQTLRDIEEYTKILSSPQEQSKILREEILAVKDKYGDARKTEIDYYGDVNIEDEDLIPKEDVIVTITETGYIKRMSPDVYKAQNRGGRGKTGMKVHEDDMVRQVVFTSTHDYLLFFTNFGRVFKLKAYRIPQASRTAKGLPIVNLLALPEGETLTAMMNVSDFETGYLFFVTEKGVVKRTAVSSFQNIRTTGIRAITLREDDSLHDVLFTDGTRDIIIGASNGKAIRFFEEDARDMGRNASGVRGISLSGDEKVVGAAVCESEDEQILVITEKGYGKRTLVSEYRKQTRGGKGVKTLNVTEKNGKLCKLLSVTGEEDLFVITDKGMFIRTPIDQIAQTGRATQGVRVMNLLDDQKVMTITVLPKDDDEDIEETEIPETENQETPLNEEVEEIKEEETEEKDPSEDLF